MSLSPGTRLGPYEVTAKIGQGGMGEVYRAHDTKLGRDVALKVLPDLFADDPERLARFQREARVLASLNHPNIASIYGLEESGDTRALVLELVEGPTLAERIAQGAIPVDEALPIAKQIADALEAAHERGVIHRDLKPANVKVKDDGMVKVLDFGLAKALEGDAGSDPSESPTLTAAATRMGVIMGTAAYMSPEQARGKTVDKRADIWAFGAVLYEMLTGQKPFPGDDVSDTLATVLKSDPNWKALPVDVPPAIKRLLRRCLEKDPKRRVREAGTAIVEIHEAQTTPSGEVAMPVTPQPPWQRVMPWVSGVVVGGIIAGLAVWSLTGPAPELSPPTRLAIAAPPGVRPFRPVASPDGRTVAFLGSTGGSSLTYIRNLNQLEAVPLSDTENTFPESFSHDGQWILISEFAAVPRVLTRVSLAGGRPITVAEWPGAVTWGATWGPDDTIVVGSNEGLFSMPVSGRERTPLTTLGEGEIAHVRPWFLPSGRAVLFFVSTGQRDEAQVAVYDFDTGRHRTLLAGTSPQFAPSGHLVFWRQESLWAVPFDPDQLEVTGEPLPVVEDVLSNPVGFANYDVTSDGTLLYTSADAAVVARASLVWVDREGNEEPVGAEPRDYRWARLSPEGRRIATYLSAGGDAPDVFIYDLDRDTLTPLTFDPATDYWPEWTPNGEHVVFASTRHAGPQNIYRKAADGTGPAHRLTTSRNPKGPNSFSPDGKTLAFGEVRPDTGGDLGLLSMDGEATIEWLLEESFFDTFGEISPDGRWIDYVSDEAGQNEVYVRPFPNVNEGKWRISTDGGVSPLWGPDSRELFYRTREGPGRPITIMMTVNDTDPTFNRGAPRRLFEGNYRMVFPNARMWDIAPNGERFLMIKDDRSSDGLAAAGQITVVQNRSEELKERVPVD